MAFYTITITPDKGGRATTTLRLETTKSGAVLTDLHLHDSAGLSHGKLPAIDYVQLLQAINTTTPTPVSATAATSPRRTTRTTRAAGSTRRSSATRAAAAAPATKTRKATTRAATTTASRAAKVTNGRAYRRMPDDLAQVYKRVGDASGVAAHYNVPKHTAYGWIRRLSE